jgi:hypothetical protein
MTRLSRSLIVVLFALAACGGGGTPAQTAGTTTATPTPTTTTTTPATTTAPTTTTPASTTTTTLAPAIAALADRVPPVSGYDYGETWPGSNWNLSDTATGASRPVLRSDGSWVAEVSVIDADTTTPTAWAHFVEDHLAALEVVAGPPVLVQNGLLYVNNRFTPSWTVLGNEVVFTATDDINGNWTGIWYHAGLVWAVSGFSDAVTYAHELIDQQAGTGQEPEQVDIDVLEGPLRAMAVDVSGFTYVYAIHPDVLKDLTDTWGDCAEHVSLQSIHPADEPDPIHTLNDADIELHMAIYSAVDPCDRASTVVADTSHKSGMRPTTIQGLSAATNTDGSSIVWVGANGVVVEVDAANAKALKRYQPLLDAIAQATKA